MMDDASTTPTILVLGPTAGGKTSLSINLANGLTPRGECLCCDSMQVYRGMDIGTAKPTDEEQAAAPHHLFDLVEPTDDSFNVDAWLRLAEASIADLRSRGRVPIIVGGTNLFIQSFLAGFMDGPGPDPELRSRLAEMDDAERRSWLERVDPVSAERIHANDLKRTIRAIEVFETSGTPLSAQQQHWDSGGIRPDVFLVGLDYPAEAINPRINERVRVMAREGLVDEVRSLWEAERLGPRAREALGYKQLIDHFEGRCSEDEALEQIKIRTRRYAKQQRTWLKRFRAYRPGIWISAADRSPESIFEEASASVQPWLTECWAAGE